MCGISGWYLKPGTTRPVEGLEAMARALNHRGPDDRGFFHDPAAGIGFAHNRLRIVDLSDRGHQPMYGRDGTFVLNYNGEIYNFVDLRQDLARRGHHFISDCDTEVVLRAYEEWGEACVEKLRGMFAFAIWSAGEQKLVLARDHAGIKPLYYAAAPNNAGLLFASEVKGFLALPDFRARPNRRAVVQFLEFGFTYDEHETSLEGVRKVPPGSLLIVRDGEVREVKRFFRPPTPAPDDRENLAQRADRLYQTLSDAVARHLIADVPVALLLSGGIDSSVIAALAARRGPLRTLTMAFAHSAVDEREHARRVALHIGSDHQEIVIAPSEIYRDLDEVIWTVDDLFADWGVVSTRLLYHRARDAGVKVVLVGEGSDEIFGGYPHFAEFSDARGNPLNIFRLYRRYTGRRYGRGFLKFRSILRSYLNESGGDMFGAVRLFELRNQMPNNYVMKVDKASMSASVEARVPYLDREVVNLALRTPKEQLLQNGRNKLLLRAMAERHSLLPRDVLERPKFGAAIAASWMDESEEFRRYSREVILDGDGWVDRLKLRDAMTAFFDRGVSGYRFPRSISIFRNLAWRLLLLNLWSRKYLPAGIQ